VTLPDSTTTETGTASPRAGSTLRSATLATYTAFAGCGFASANWAARIPQVRDHLGLTPSALGLVLLAIAAGSVLALPLSGTVIHRFGSRRTVAAMAALVGVALVLVAVGYLAGVVPVVVGLFLCGFGSGAWDVAMNVHAADVERRLDRSIMSRFHAGYSLGTVAGALTGAAAVALHLPVTVHLLLVAVVVGTWVPLGARRFLPDHGGPAAGSDAAANAAADGPRHSALAAWREPRTLLIGVCVLAFAFTEGAGNDWIGVAVIDGYGVPAALGTLAFATFLAAMTAARWYGPALLDRYGRVPVVRTLAVLALAGLLLFVFAPAAPVAYLGALLWGIGASLGFPVGMSAAADDPSRAAGRVSAVASIGYCAFLAGPPLIGFLGDHLGVLRALTAVAALLALGALTSGSLRSGPTPAADPAGLPAGSGRRGP
jgi:MFS family permease